MLLSSDEKLNLLNCTIELQSSQFKAKICRTEHTPLVLVSEYEIYATQNFFSAIRKIREILWNLRNINSSVRLASLPLITHHFCSFCRTYSRNHICKLKQLLQLELRKIQCE